MQSNITIFTEPISGPERALFLLKAFVKRCLRVRTFGPVRVRQGVLEGLRELGMSGSCNVDPAPQGIAPVVYVPGPAEALRSAIRLKRSGKIRRLVAGPNVSVPMSRADVFFAPEVDVVIAPCEWVRDYFLSLSPDDARIRVWAAGTELLPPSPRRGGKVLVYRKSCPDALFSSVLAELERRGIPAEVLRYGEFRREDYLAALDRVSAMVYLQESESQGLALQEAWMKDIPTLVWDRGFWEYGRARWSAPKISAPYLTDACGRFFAGAGDFPDALSRFRDALPSYAPRDYAVGNFTNAAATRRLLDIIHS